MKIVKTDWRSKLNESNLESLLRIKVEGPSLKGFAETFCSKAVHLWWDKKEQRVNQGKQKQYKDRTSCKTKCQQFTNAYIDEFLGGLYSSSSDKETDEDIKHDILYTL